MHPDLERIVAEDEVARAAIEAAVARVRARLETARRELAGARAQRLAELTRQVDAAVAAIQSDCDREAAARADQRAAFARLCAAVDAAPIDDAVRLFASLVLDADASRGAP